MGKRYLEIKENSLESSVFNILHWIQEETIEEGKVTVDLENDDPKMMKDIKSMGLKVKDHGKTGNAGYNEYTISGPDAALKKGGKKFGWDQQTEKLDPVGKEDGDIDNDGDKDASDKYLAKRRKTIAKAIKKDKKEGNAFGMALKSAKDKGEKTFVVSGKTYEVKEELDLDEGKMAQMHQMMKDKKSAEQIAKAMKLDLKTIKSLMASYEQMVPESYEIGTEKYLKHTVNVTPGQKEWTETVTKKASSMREIMAKMWKFDEGKNVFEKDTKKDLTKGVKGSSITMTGKKVADIDTNPIIKEKKK
jgi:hypothetical protein